MSTEIPLFLSISDYFVQGVLLFLTFVYPCTNPRGRKMHPFGFPFGLGCLWGIWRMANFDPATHNDIPGIAYFVQAFVYGIIGTVIYALRCVTRRRNRLRDDEELKLKSS